MENEKVMKNRARKKLMRGCVWTISDEQMAYPTKWNSVDKDEKLEVSENGLQVSYTGEGKSDRDAASLRADSPIPQSGVALFYCEVKIVCEGESKFIGLGLSQKNVELNRLPGSESHSLGYHIDDGFKFPGSGTGCTYGPQCSTGDVIGVCWNLEQNNMFFTKNGKSIGVAFSNVRGSYYPSVGLQSCGGVVLGNFGDSPFVFDIEGYAYGEKQETLSSVMQVRVPGSFDTFSEIIITYLLHNGYIETAKAYAADVGKLEQIGDDLEFASKCKQICDLVRRGEIDEAMQALQTDFPSMLKDPKVKIVFDLKCQQLVELSRTNQIEDRLAFAQEHLHEYQDMGEEYSKGLADVIVLVAYPDLEQSPYSDLLEESRRDKVAEDLNQALQGEKAAHPCLFRITLSLSTLMWVAWASVSRGKLGRSTLERLVSHCEESLRDLRRYTTGHGAILSLRDVLNG
uniref:B30.2/SPRY domain-containing protein n=2 Tax=Rhodosorus marinus TaxID=101924 RepID=A0A7S3EBH9_9RHOD|mmetsp:Transcript_23007/g.92104  ORF Transcript_23007/g.92104 Transcript_23007/m.92104 type:complete len:457 (+) Transcript_23007:352-1722(+)